MAPGTDSLSLDDLVGTTERALKKGRAVLFLGAGASMEGKGPSGRELTDAIRRTFADVDFEGTDFLDICQAVVETPPHDIEQLREAVLSELTGLDVPNGHYKIARLPWTAIFTTNYDDVIERAFDHKDTPRRCVPIYLEDRGLWFPRADQVPYFKLMGCVRRRASEAGEMVLTRGQYNRLAPERHQALGLLYDALKNGVLLFAGYGFADRLVFDALDQLIQEYSIDNIPWSYCLGPKLPSSPRGVANLSKRRITPVEGVLSQFADEVWKRVRKSDLVHVVAGPPVEVVQLRDARAELSPEICNTRTDAFVLLTEAEIGIERGTKDDFFEGKDVGWSAYRRGWDFKRCALSPMKEANQDLHAYVKQLSSQRAQHGHRLIALLGGPGTGKTTLAKRIAFDVYTEGLCPVILLNFHALRVDFGQIEDLLVMLQTQLTKSAPDARELPFLLIVDDAAVQLRQWYKLMTYLASRGHFVIMLAVERLGEWNHATREFSIPEDSVTVFDLTADFSGEERARIADHLAELGYLRVRGPAALDIIHDTLRDSLFATFYTFVHPSRVPLNRIVEQQYAALPPMQREAFAFVCLLYQYDLSTPFELLVRTLGTDFVRFHNDVLSGAAAAIIYEEPEVEGRLSYRPHHRIVAERVVAKFLSDEERLFDMYRRLFSKVNLSNPGDWKVVVRLVVDYIGPNAAASPLPRDRQRELLDILIAKGAGRSVLHHRGILAEKEGKYDEAESFLKRALENRQRVDESYQRESDQNILTSLGSLYSTWGIEVRRAGQLAQSERLLEEAARCFLQARSGRFENGHAYHAHANMLRRKAQADKDLAAIDFIGEALDILDQAKEVLDDEVLMPIRELETELLAEFGSPEVVSQAAEELAGQHGSSAGYAVWAATEQRRLPPPSTKGFAEAAKNVIGICEAGLKVNGKDYRILRTLATCYRALGVKYLRQRYEALLRLKSCAPRFMPDVVYKLGCVAFGLRQFKEAKMHFGELGDRAEAEDIRFRGREFVADESGQRKRFSGVIHECEERHGDITCREFREPYFAIHFNPRYLTSSVGRGDPVNFHVHFNVFGPYARDVRRGAS